MPHAIVVCGSTIYDRTYTDRNFSILRRLYDRCLDYRRFASAALDCCQIAAGRAEIFFECRLSPWDYAAGTLIAQEAGATATRLEGGPMDPLHAGSVFITNGVCPQRPLRTPAVKTKNCQQRVLPFADKLKWLPEEGSHFSSLPDHTGAQESWSTPLRYSLGDTPMTSRKARANLLALS